MRILTEFLKKHRLLGLLTLAALLGQTTCILLLPYFTEHIVDYGIIPRDLNIVFNVVGQMLGVTLLGCAFSFACTYFTARLAALFGLNLRKDLFRHIQSLSLEDCKQYGSASLATRTSSDVANIQQVLVMLIQQILPGFLMGIVAVIMTWQVSKTLAAIIILTLFIFFGAIALIFIKSMPYMQAIQYRIDGMISKLREIFVGVKIIRAFDNSSYEEERTNETFKKHADNMIQINRLFAFVSPIAFLLLGLVLTAVLRQGLGEVVKGNVQIGTVTAVIEYITLALLQLLSGALVTVMIPRAVASLGRIELVLTHIPTVLDNALTKNNQIDPALEDIIVFDNVTFQYPGAEEPVLKNISFTCQRGKTTAIIGATASGKSTVGKVIMRFADIQKGTISLGGVDLRSLSQQAVRELISYVPQTAFLFSGTIRENIAYSNPDLSDEYIHKAAQIAHADEFIAQTKDGYNSFVARAGTNFSGGQKQRLCIARALAKEASVYIFDDSFSALDNTTDYRVRCALKKEIKNAAMIIVAQKLSTIVDADQILLIEKGEIVGRGTHRELLKNNEIYQAFAKSQQLKEQGEQTHAVS